MAPRHFGLVLIHPRIRRRIGSRQFGVKLGFVSCASTSRSNPGLIRPGGLEKLSSSSEGAWELTHTLSFSLSCYIACVSGVLLTRLINFVFQQQQEEEDMTRQAKGVLGTLPC